MRAICSILIAVVLLMDGVSMRAADRSVEPIVSRIPREPIASSALRSIGYSKRLRALEIEFHDGLIYRYVSIPYPIYLELIGAESKAGYYNHHIRGKYHCLRVKRTRAR